MATKEGMSGVDVHAVVAEWQKFLPLWVSKIYQFSSSHIVIRLNGQEHARHLLLVESGRRAHLVSSIPAPPKLPPPFAMLLRKHLEGGRVLGVSQPGLQRIICFDIGKQNTTFHLVIELFDQGNLVLCNDAWTIIQPLRPHRFRERDIIAGEVYRLPPADPATFSREAFGSFLKNDDRDVVRALAVGALLGGRYAEYLCRKAGVEKTIPAGEADADRLYRELQALMHRAEEGIEPVLTGRECLPFPEDAGSGTAGTGSFNQALDRFFPGIPSSPAEAAPAAKGLSKEERIRKRQSEILAGYEQKAARTEKIAAMMYESYQDLGDIIRVLDEASRRMSWQEIEQVLRKGRDGPAGRIRSVNPADASVEVDIGERVTLYVHESLEANIGRYYDTLKKLRKKIAGAKAAMDRPVAPPRQQRAGSPVMKKRWYHRFRWFSTSDGVLVIGGKDASQNEELVKRYMEGGDRFVHADVHGASVVIVKGRTGRMDEVTQFAASYSGAWRSGHATADVYAADPGQVSKTPESGEYVSRGSFIVRGEREYFRDVPLAAAIGLQREPELAVIGGPPSAVACRTSLFVVLKPGTFEPNDTAKKVLRALRARIGEEEARTQKAVLNTDRIAAFVPPGGSDIVEP
ncbi:MAG: NFACT family protein [Methanoregulaceae archaeon]|jgi:predicted ribosome quality control (RQC) complex YloA/Tae2 family protein|nr:NFACT family protein [Methanoregulaceae archaeon]MCC7469102.1 NFACT family protein [Burkholderiaceae bacterium]NLH25541.1 fibronectin-binding domain-containing protein [Methanomicrobiales archaeon]HMZ30941.1 ribosome rescue protein RqcH [Methanoregulaceae archaeon]HPS23757.1 ribosome rescue protein RqcH [Methanoregulaceae archaeon]